MSAATIRQEVVPVGGGRLQLRVEVAGSGPPLVYLHPAGGLSWDPFLLALAEHRTVWAPLLPGTSPEDPNAIDEIRDLWELVLVEQEALSALGLAGADIVGGSFGGMLGCELQATFPGMFGRLVVLDPIGLWREDAPLASVFITPPEELPALLYHDLSDPAVQAALTLPDDPGERADVIALRTWTLGCVGKFMTPVPDRGLGRRLHRISAPTLIIWGEEDRLVPAIYADEFAAGIADSRVEILSGCGHVPQVERCEETLALVRGFLAI